MVVLNVIGWRDRFSDLYVCYCYELDSVFAEEGWRDALDGLGRDIEGYREEYVSGRRPAISPNSGKRDDVHRAFDRIFFGKLTPNERIELRRGDILDFYGFDGRDFDVPFLKSMEPSVEEIREMPASALSKAHLDEDDIPF